MDDYRLYLRFEAAETLRILRGAQRTAIIAFVDSLKSDPNSRGDYSETDETGRNIEIKVIGSFAITYWPDHPVKEVKVVDISRADRA
jgi:hypothetical protein